MRSRFHRHFTGPEALASIILFLVFVLFLLNISFLSGFAASPEATVVISEVMWMGSDLSTADEWVELAGRGPDGSSIDLSGWKLTSLLTKGETAIVSFSTGTILHAGEFFLVSNYSGAATRLLVSSNLVSTTMSLPNTKLLLRLRDSAGTIHDEVDDGVGEPFAGANITGSPKASMERIALDAPGTVKENWRTATVSRGFKEGAAIFGTPGSENGEVMASSASSAASLSSDGGQEGTVSVSSAPQSSESEVGLDSSESSEDAAAKGCALCVASAKDCALCVASAKDCASCVESSESSASSVSSVLQSSESEVGLASSEDAAAKGCALCVASEKGCALCVASEKGCASCVDSSSSPQTESPTIPSVRISEILANPAGSDDREWIELSNNGAYPVPIAGWRLTSGSGAHSFIIPAVRTASGAFPPSASSGFVLAAGEHVSFRKTFSHLTLLNGGSRIALFSGSLLIDTVDYPEALEGISFGRDESGSGGMLRSFCIPTEGALNIAPPLHPTFALQDTNGTVTGSASVLGIGHVSVNLAVALETGSLVAAQCSFDYGDGTVHHTCNPPSHSFSTVGEHAIHLSLDAACGEHLERTFLATVESSQAFGASGAPSSSCTVRSFAGITVNELFPYPHDKKDAWIEFMNTTDETVYLCGWSLQSRKGIMRSGSLDKERIFPHGFLPITSSVIDMPLQHGEESIRLLDPAGNPVAVVTYSGAVRGQAFARRDDGVFVWTTFPTPGERNRFRTAERRFLRSPVIISAAYPNPPGDDQGREWVEIQNRGNESVSLNYWSIDTGEGSGTPFSLDGVTLQPLEIRRFTDSELHLRLKNSRGRARLLDPDLYVASALGWASAAEGTIVRPSLVDPAYLRVHVPYVIDGDTIVVALDDFPPEVWKSLPPALERRWSALRLAGERTLRVRLIGIDAPELHDPVPAVGRLAEASRDFLRSQIEGASVDLQFDETLFDKYDRLLAYVSIPHFSSTDSSNSQPSSTNASNPHPSSTDSSTPYPSSMGGGESAEEALLRRGLARAYTVFPFARSQEYLVLEEEARAARLGIWADEETAKQVLVGFPEGSTLLEYLRSHKLTLKIEPKTGLVSSGTVVQFIPSVAADVFVSTASGAFRIQSGGLLVTDDVELKAYAEVRIPVDGSGTQIFRSPVVERQFAVRREQYGSGVVLSEVYAVPFPSSLSPGPSPLHAARLPGEGRLQNEFKITEEEWIELQNLSPSPVSLSFWQLDDRADGGSRPFTLPFGTVIGSGGFLLFPASLTKLSLNNGGDDVRLLSPDGVTVDFVTYGRRKAGESYSRIMTGTGAVWCVAEPTPGQSNRCREEHPSKRVSFKAIVAMEPSSPTSSNSQQSFSSFPSLPSSSATIEHPASTPDAWPVTEVVIVSMVCLAGWGFVRLQ